MSSPLLLPFLFIKAITIEKYKKDNFLQSHSPDSYVIFSESSFERKSIIITCIPTAYSSSAFILYVFQTFFEITHFKFVKTKTIFIHSYK